MGSEIKTSYSIYLEANWFLLLSFNWLFFILSALSAFLVIFIFLSQFYIATVED